MNPLVSLMIEYAKKFIGQPYIWGGSNPVTGFDCSGLQSEVLMAVGIGPGDRETAQRIYDYFQRAGDKVVTDAPSAGALVFYGASRDSVTHIALCIDGVHMLEEGGGTSKNTTVQIAGETGAFCRIRPIHRRKDIVAIILPAELA